MNKFKLFYDVIKTMKEKEVISGTLKVNGKKDMHKILGLENDFEKNMVNGRTKIKLVTEMDCAGKKVKHESNTEFEMQGCHGHKHHCFMRHMHHHHNHGAKYLLPKHMNWTYYPKRKKKTHLTLLLQKIPCLTWIMIKKMYAINYCP